MHVFLRSFFFFFFNDTATTEIYTLSLHDALPIFRMSWPVSSRWMAKGVTAGVLRQVCSCDAGLEDRKSTRLNSSHSQISYAVFCLKKKKKRIRTSRATTHPCCELTTRMTCTDRYL